MFYIYGIIGVILSLWFYVRTIGRKIEISAWMSMFIIVLSFFSVYRFYLTVFALIGYKIENADLNGRKLSFRVY